MRRSVLFITLLLLTLAVPAAAQVAIANPTKIEFNHDAYDVTETYRIAFTLSGATSETTHFDVARPLAVPIAGTSPTVYQIDVTQQVIGIPINTNGTTYTATVEAINSVGSSGASAPSGPFTHLGAPTKPAAVTIRK